jgi:putative inorganic carbon (HCO3(-)) transporter
MTVLLVLANGLLLSGTLLLTQSRGGLLGFGASFLFILLVVLRRHRGIVLTLILLAVMGAIALAFDKQMADAALAVLGGSSDTGSLGGSSLAGRWEIWTRAVYGIQDFPFTGMGVGTFRNIVNLRYPLSLLNQNTDIAHAHNHLLQTGLDLGIPGLVAYIALWLGCAMMLWRSWRYSSSFWLRLLAVGLAANLVAYGVYGMVDTVALGARPGFIFWLLLGLIAGLYSNVERGPVKG